MVEGRIITKEAAEAMAREFCRQHRSRIAAMIEMKGGKMYNTAQFAVAGFTFKFTDDGEPYEVENG
jgi:hypothetical protein